MFEKIIIRSVTEEADAFVIASGNGKTYRVKKSDLKGISLKVGDSVCVFIHPNYPNVVAGLKLGSHTIFHKMREDLIDEYLQDMEERVIKELPELAQHRLKMFEQNSVDFVISRRFEEATALLLGFKLFCICGDIGAIADFTNASYDMQKRMLPYMGVQVLPSVPVEKISEIALAFLNDTETETKLEDSVLMHLPLADSERYGDLCQPRDEYISKYAATLKN